MDNLIDDDIELKKIRDKKIKELINQMNKSEENVKVYSTKTCPYCVMAKQYLSQRGVKYQDIDVGTDRKAAMEMVAKSGQMGVPVIEINGSVILGFDKDAIDNAIGKN